MVEARLPPGAEGGRERAPSPTGGAVLLLFAAALFTSAFLLFWVQPLVAKMVLPLLGGSPSVWNTCMVFFQSTLLAGYLYAHLIVTRVKAGLQPVVHLLLLGGVFFFLPLSVAVHGKVPATSEPAGWLLLLLVISVGLPAFALSGTAPLLQAWFSRTRHASASDPYFLYSASNLGSILALVGYPLLIEPGLPIPRQSALWSLVFILFVLLLGGCATLLYRAGTAPLGKGTAGSGAGGTAPSSPDRGRKAMWLLLAFVPSSLLLGVTAHITTDVAAVPLLWVLPLALYLATFIIAFSRRPLIPHRVALAAQPFALLALGLAFTLGEVYPTIALPVHLLAFFATALVCHGELAARRPPATDLTSFYLWLSVGGVLGGIFNALLAPLLFKGVAEYTLLVVAAVFLRPNLLSSMKRRPWLDLLLPAAVLAFLLFADRLLRQSDISFHYGIYLSLGLSLVASAAVFLLRARPAGLGLGLGAIVAAGILTAPHLKTLRQERNFFGVLRVAENAGTRIFLHGKTMHGAQSLDPAWRGEPLLYHAAKGPLGELFAAFKTALAGKKIAVAGLGAGVMAAYGQSGQEMVFYEIDPAVERIARDRRYFTFLADSPASVRVVIGDARLRIAEAPAGEYAMIVVDVFSSDAIPVHLLTREALRLYLEKLAPGGILAFNISNAFLDLQPVLHALAADAGLVSAIRWGSGNDRGAVPSTWVVMARSLADLIPLRPYPEWYRTAGRSNVGPWTDGFSNVVSVLKLR